MLFDGAFVLPSWLRQLAIIPADVIEHCRREEGAPAGPASAAALALAEWLLDDAVRAEREARTPGSPLSMGGVMTRLLAGVTLPGEEQAAAIERMTGGRVPWAAWSTPSNTHVAGSPAAPAAEADPLPKAMLGETAAGPLWTARARGDRIELASAFGVALDMHHHAGEKLWRDLTAIFAPPGAAAPAHMGVY